MFRDRSYRGVAAFRLMACVLLILGVAAGSAFAAGPREETKDGVVHVMNPAKPMQKPVTIEMEEVWRIGGEDDDEIFGVITDVLKDKIGKVKFSKALISIINFSGPNSFFRPINLFFSSCRLCTTDFGVIPILPPPPTGFIIRGNPILSIRESNFIL